MDDPEMAYNGELRLQTEAALAQTVFPSSKSGGKPTFLTLSLIRVELISARMAFNVEALAQVLEPQGQEGGLAPALMRNQKTFSVDSRVRHYLVSKPPASDGSRHNANE